MRGAVATLTVAMLATLTVIAPAAAQEELPRVRGEVTWNMLSSDTGDLDVPFPAGAEQTDAQIFDVDNDGLNDIVVSNRNVAPAGVWYERNSTGWTKHVFEDGQFPLEAGGTHHDIDGDGDLDIAIGEDLDGSHIYWWENPYPIFDPATPWTRHEIKNSGEPRHHDVIFGDIDADGTEEFVWWQDENDLRIAEIPADPTAGPWPFDTVFSDSNKNEGLAIADVDLDGVDDIIGAGRWYERIDATTYTAHVVDPAMTFSRAAAGQLIPGGRPELVFVIGDVSGPIDGTSFLTVHEWDGAVWVPTQPIGELSDSAHSLDIVDFNADGLLDIFVAEMTIAGNADAKGRVLFGDGTGNYEIQVFSDGVDNHQSKVGDLDGDGDLDILGKPFDGGAPVVNIWINEEIDIGVLPLDQWVRHSVDGNMPWLASHALWGDFDLDGFMDIVSGGWIYEHQGGDYTQPWTRTLIGAPLNNVALVHDFDGDGDLDLLGTDGVSQSPTHPGSVTFHWGRNDGAGNFTILSNIEPGVATRVEAALIQGISVADLDQDGTLNVAVSWNYGDFGDSGVDVLTVPADPSTDVWEMNTISPISEGEEIPLDDIDGDGDLDIFQGSGWLRNEYPTAAWTRIDVTDAIGNLTPYDNADRISLADVDGDGDKDAVVGLLFEFELLPTDFIWLEHPDDPTQEWPYHVIGTGLGGGFSMSTGDIDNDGDIDAVLGEHTQGTRLLLYENHDLATSWTEHIIDPGGSGIDHHDGALLVDFDNDFDLDIVSVGWHNQKVWFYENKALEPGDISDVEPPSAPTALAATAWSSSRIDLTWDRSLDNRGIFQYRVLRDGIEVGTTAGLAFSDTGLTPDTSHEYTVIGIDHAGNESPASAPATTSTLTLDVTPPTEPTNLTALPVTTRVDLAWDAATDDRGVTDYIISRDGVEIATISGATTNFSDTNLEADTAYLYEVVARDADGNTSPPGGAQVTAITLPPPTGLWAAYGFEGTGPAVPDATIYGNDGTLQAPAAFVADGVSGQALELNGSTGYADLGTLDIPTDELTLMAWINADDFGVHDARIISKSTSSSGADHVWMLSTLFGEYPRFRLRTDDGNSTSTLIGFDGSLTAGTWHHVAATYDGADMRIFLDGMEVGSQPKTGAVAQDPAVSTFIGANPGDDDQVFDGRIDDVKIFGSALSAAEIALEMATPVSPPAPDTEAPSAPASLTGAADSQTAITIDWGAATDNTAVASYAIARNGTTVATVPASQRTFTDTGLTADTPYDYTVTATDAAANTGPAAGPLTITTDAPDTEAPTAPPSLTGAADSRSAITIDWTAATDNTAIATYTVSRDDTPIATVPADQLTFTDTALTAETPYDYTVHATDTAGNDGPTAGPLTITTDAPDTEPPTAPASLTGAADGAAQLTIDWGAATDNTAIATYTVSRDDTPIATVPASQRTFTDTGLSAETTYSYTVFASDTAGNDGAPAGPTLVTTDPAPTDILVAYNFNDAGPTIVDHSGNNLDATLLGTASLVPEGQFDGTARFTGTTNAVGAVDLGGLDIPGNELTIAAWVNVDDFDVNDGRIISKANGTAANSHWWMLSTLGGERVRLRLKTDDGNNTTTLIGPSGVLTPGAWHFVAATYDGAAMRLYVDGVEVASAAKSGGIADDPGVDVQIGANPGTDNKNLDGRVDELRILTRALSPTDLQALAVTPISPPAPDTEAPSAPASLTGAADSQAAITIDWGTATDNTAVASYTVSRDDNPIATVPADQLTFTDTGLTADTPYDYTVHATDTAGNDGPTAGPLTITTDAPDTEAPTAPASLTGAADSQSAITIDWGTATDNTAVASYTVSRDDTPIATVPADQLTFPDTGLTAETPYDYTVTATDAAANTGPAAGPLTITTDAPDTEAPSAPSSLTGAADSQSAITIDWGAATDNTTVASYAIARNGTTVATVPASQLTFTDTGLTADTPYDYTVHATDTAGNDGPTAGPLTITTDAAPPDVLVAYNFEDTGPTIVDHSGNNLDATLNAPALLGSPGQFGYALETTGSTGAADLGTLDIVGDQLTIAAWVRADDFGIYDARIVSKSTSSAGNDHLWMLSTITGQRLRFRLQTDDGNDTTTLIGTGGSLTAGTWHFVAATYDGAEMKLFLDGVEVGSTAKTGLVAGDDTVGAWIGNNPGNDQQAFDGRIDEFRILTRALDATELTTLATTPIE
ncbi:MAG: hypothetical protein DHS20C19_05140 [Acidimicrobiales bacterium]|nr:MAG: hypothetical protein DHS20C19_05140 [Acidimicrobiales bacterium]